MVRRTVILPRVLALALFAAAAAPSTAAAQGVSAPRPFGHWSFDACAGGQVVDQGATPHHAQLHGTAFCGDGRYDGGAVFDGAPDSRVEVSNASAFAAPRFTVAAWVKPSGPGAIVNRWWGPDVWGLWFLGDRFVFAVTFPGGQWGNPISVTAPAVAGRWAHVTGSYDGSRIALYVDGVLAAWKPASGTPQASSRPIVIGNHPSWDGFEGSIDEVLFYDRALSAGEVSAVASSPPPPPWALPAVYEAEASSNVLHGVYVDDFSCTSYCSGGAVVRGIGEGGSLRFENVMAPATGRYLLEVDWLGYEGEALVSVNGRPPALVPFTDGDFYAPTTRVLRVDLNAGANAIDFASAGRAAPDIDRVRLTEGAIDHVILDEVPTTGDPVLGAAATHEHVASELAFSGKWFWGSVEGAEAEAMRSCDGSGDTHAGVAGLCAVGMGDQLGLDTCCHSGGMGECQPKRTEGYTGDPEHDYLEWPKWDTNAHPRYWHGHLRRALEGGLKLIVAHAVENYPLCSLVRSGVGTNPFRQEGFECDKADSLQSIVRQILFLKTLASNHADFLEIAYSAADARRIISEGKMAIVIGIEADYAWDPYDNPVDRLEYYHDLGARTAFLAHSLNTRIAGTAIYVPQFAAQQSFLNCFLHNVQCQTDPNNPFATDPEHPFAVDQSNQIGCSPSYATSYEELCSLKLAERFLDVSAWDGFKVYPGGGVVAGVDATFTDAPVTVNKNVLGLTYEGAQVVDRMMDKGMLLEIGHISEQAIEDVYALASARYGYPLVASHVYARRISADGSAGWEGKLGDDALQMIAETEGFAGHFTGGDVALDYPNSGVENDCARSTRSLAQSVAYAADMAGMRVAWAGDFQGLGQGVAPRLGYTSDPNEWCMGHEAEQCRQRHGGFNECHICVLQNQSQDACTLSIDRNLSHYATQDEKDWAYFHTRGYAHHGLIAQLHNDLEAVGLRPEYLSALRDQSAETFIRTWEKSEYIAPLPRPLRGPRPGGR
ncbi:LamG-like jellyroll fold domain-containing protein [Sorangium sp. So ce341]|uniref:LamG-like jellyroll fold domain-containing protein n=1 Tax=Sorangium sp. So ce341 TaxID=3133302 RepID=UPI003F5F69CC